MVDECGTGHSQGNFGPYIREPIFIGLDLVVDRLSGLWFSLSVLLWSWRMLWSTQNFDWIFAGSHKGTIEHLLPSVLKASFKFLQDADPGIQTGPA